MPIVLRQNKLDEKRRAQRKKIQSACEVWAALLHRYPESAHKGGKTHKGHGFPCHHTFQCATNTLTEVNTESSNARLTKQGVKWVQMVLLF